MAFYSVSQTLMGGNPDRNRRMIYRHRDKDDIVGVEVCIFNFEMREWTDQRESELAACLKALRDEKTGEGK